MIIAIDYDGTIADTNREKVQWIAAQLGKQVPPWMCNRTDCVPLIGLDAYEKMGGVIYEEERTLQAVGLSDLADEVVTADDVSVGKPAPDVYLEAASRLEVAPEKCVAFEDAPSGIMAAQTAGMQVVAVPAPLRVV